MSKQLTHTNFDNFYLSKGMLKTLDHIEYRVPTPVQAASIPLVMAGIDLIVQAQTGTGKTAAFAIPITEMLSHNPGTIEVLVLAPTRELAKQVSEEFARLCKFKDVEVATVYGGTGYEAQHRALETAQVVVATPGRLLDLANRGHADLSNLRIFGLDEADEMLSMGFAEEVDAIISKLPEDRQNLLFSATITEDVKQLGKTMLYYPEFVTLSSDSVAADDVLHVYFPVSGVGRARDLLQVLEHEEPENAIVFANTKNDTFAVTRFLKRHGLRAEVLNGDLPQKERERTLGMLRRGEIDFLVATDVAARGIDISELSHVINYVVPESAEVYVHRTGRTGRAGLKGTALSLISPREMATLFNIRKVYGIDMQKRPLPTPVDVLEAKRSRRLQQLDDTLNRSDLPYGAALGLAQQLVNAQGEAENVKLLARLIALADKVAQGELDDVDLKASVSAKTKQVEAEIEVEAEIDVEIEIELEDAKDDAAAEADEVEAAAPKREKRTRRNGRAESSSKAEPEEAQSASNDDDDERPRRRRRRRRKNDDDAAEASEAPSPKPEKKDDDDGESKSSRSRRNSNKNGKSRSRRGRGRDNDRGSERSSDRNGAAKAPKTEIQNEMSKIWVNMGRNHFDAAEEVVEMVCFMAGMDPEDLGSVTLENSYSYVEVREDYFYDIITAMNNQDWNGITVSAEPARK